MELPKQSPKLCVYSAGFLSSAKYMTSPVFVVVCTYCVSAASVVPKTESHERRRIKTPDHDAPQKGDREKAMDARVILEILGGVLPEARQGGISDC